MILSTWLAICIMVRFFAGGTRDLLCAILCIYCLKFPPCKYRPCSVLSTRLTTCIPVVNRDQETPRYVHGHMTSQTNQVLVEFMCCVYVCVCLMTNFFPSSSFELLFVKDSSECLMSSTCRVVSGFWLYKNVKLV